MTLGTRESTRRDSIRALHSVLNILKPPEHFSIVWNTSQPLERFSASGTLPNGTLLSLWNTSQKNSEITHFRLPVSGIFEEAGCTQAPTHCLPASGNEAEPVRRRSRSLTSKLSLSAAIGTLMDYRKRPESDPTAARVPRQQGFL